jgi:DNA-binding IclR family transcriptional regulator
MDLHAGAAGKIILAYSSAELVETVLAKAGLPERTAATITDKPALLMELENVRNQGYAVSTAERAADACALAAPVFEYGHELVGALCISGPISRFTVPIRESYANLLVAAAIQLSRQLGWTRAADEKRAQPGSDDSEGEISDDYRKKASA